MKTRLGFLTFALVVVIAHSARALSIYGLTPTNGLLLFDADHPANIVSIRAITGLDIGDNLVGIDVRPKTGQLYALSDDGSLYIINPATAAATKVTQLAADPADVTNPFTALSGTNFGIDFNPVPDRLRVVSNLDQNLRINVDTGLVTTDTPLAYSPAPDRNAGENPNIGDVAYANNFDGATTTTLFAIDEETLDLVTIGGVNVPPGTPSPNTGLLFSPADPAPRFGNVLATHEGFDIAPNGTAYIVGVHPGPEYILVAGDVATGELESHGPIGDGTTAIRDIAVAPTISFSAQQYASAETTGANVTITVKREGFVNVATPLSVQFTTHSDTASAASDYTTTSGTLTFPVKPVTAPADTSDTLTFQVPIIDDTLPEGDEFFDVFLTGISAGEGVIGFPDSATVRINTNDSKDKAGPQVLRIGLTGPSRGISGAVVHFNEDLAETTAEDVSNYKFTAFKADGTRVVMPVTAAVYDPVGRRVTLSLDPFGQTAFTRTALRVKGDAGGVRDVSGNILDGDRNGLRGGDAVQIFKVFHGKTISFRDRDGDVATLTIEEGGRIDGVRPVGGPNTQITQFWILDPIALRSTLSGTVLRRTSTGDGIVVIAEIIGLDKKEFTPLLTNPSFRVNTLTFSSNATGI
jgi:hypothetical protein